MANRLAMDKSQAITSLAATGMSERRIARTLGVSRKAVRQHLGREAPKETKAPPGSTELPEPLADESRSLCAAYRSSILEKLEQGLTAQRIFQDLRDEQGFPGRYHSVRRYVRRLTASTNGVVPPIMSQEICHPKFRNAIWTNRLRHFSQC